MNKVIYEFKREKYPNEISIAALSREECITLSTTDAANVQTITIEGDKKMELLLNGWCNNKEYVYRSFIF